MSMSVIDPADQFCFILMPFDPAFNHVYSNAIAPAVEEAGLQPIRADEIESLGIITQQIQEHIESAAIIIADLTDKNPNVFYELGIAHAYEKQVIMLTQRDGDVPFDIRHRRYFRYLPDAQGLTALRVRLKDLISSHCFPLNLALAKMFAPENKGDVCLLYGAVLSKVRISDLTPGGLKAKQNDLLGLEILTSRLRRIFGDRLHVVDANAVTDTDNVLNSDSNIILTGGPKANPWYEPYVERIRADRTPRWEFEPVDEHNTTGPWQLTLNTRPMIAEEGKDYGLILRGPFGDEPSSLIVVLVGLGSPGQMAANIAATDSYLISEIDKKPNGMLSDKKARIWVLVTCYTRDYKIRQETIRIEDAGVFR